MRDSGENSSKRISNSASRGDTSRAGRYTFFLLGFTLIFATLLYGAVDTGTLSLLSIISVAIIVLWSIDAWTKREFRFSSSSLQLPIIVLGMIGAIQLLPLQDTGVTSDLLTIPATSSLSLDQYSTRFFLMRLAVYLVFFASALTFVNSRSRMKQIVLTIVIFGSAIAFFGILQWLSNPQGIYGLRAPTQAIPFGTFINQHHFAALMEMTAGLTLGLLFGKAFHRNRRPFLIIATVMMGIAIVLTGSRGGLLSFAGTLGFVVLASFFSKETDTQMNNSDPAGRLRQRLALFAGGSALLLLIAGLAIFLGGGESLLRGTGVQIGQEDFTSGRSYFWQAALKIFWQHPFIGSGLDAFGVAFTKFDTTSGMFRVEQAHNDYLQMLADAGIAGFLCIAAFIYLLFRKSTRIIGETTDSFRRSAAVGALAGCLGILVHSFFDFPLRTPANAFFFLMLVVIATVGIKNGDSRRTKGELQRQD